MPIGTDAIRGVLKLDGFIEGKYFTSWQDFVQSIPDLFSVEVPNNITNVTIGSTEPSSSERDNMWFKENSAGSPVGIFIYSGGAWKQFLPVPNEIHLIYGDSRTPPFGYTVVTDSPVFSPAQVAEMQKVWSVGGTTPTPWWTVFHVVWTGF